MNHSPTEPSAFPCPWALQMLRLLVVPALLALALLSASVLYVHWGPERAGTPDASSPAVAAEPSRPDTAEATRRDDATTFRGLAR
jgi:hypothetical protein